MKTILHQIARMFYKSEALALVEGTSVPAYISVPIFGRQALLSDFGTGWTCWIIEGSIGNMKLLPGVYSLQEACCIGLMELISLGFSPEVTIQSLTN